MASVPDAQVFITSPPAILGLGDAGGFTLELQDEGGAGHAAAVAARNTLLKEAARIRSWSTCAMPAWKTRRCTR
jgi:multidrug efflux pump